MSAHLVVTRHFSLVLLLGGSAGNPCTKHPQGCAAGERLADGNAAEPQRARWVLGRARLPPGICSWGSRSAPSQPLALLLTPAPVSLPSGLTEASSQDAGKRGSPSLVSGPWKAGLTKPRLRTLESRAHRASSQDPGKRGSPRPCLRTLESWAAPGRWLPDLSSTHAGLGGACSGGCWRPPLRMPLLMICLHQPFHAALAVSWKLAVSRPTWLCRGGVCGVREGGQAWAQCSRRGALCTCVERVGPASWSRHPMVTSARITTSVPS